MNNYIKQAIYITLISIIFSIIRYFFIDGNFYLIKKSNIIDTIIDNDYSNISELEKYLSTIQEPTLIDFDLTKQIYDNKLATFIDARDYDSYNKLHIKNAINIPYDNINLIEKEYDLIWMYDQVEDFSFLIEGFDTNFILGKHTKIPFIRDFKLRDLNQSIEGYEMIFVIYCSGEGCSLSEDLSFYLFEKFNFKRIMVFEGGMPIWEANNMDVE